MAHPHRTYASNAERTRSSNRQAVLGQIQSAGQMGRAEIARILGLSTQAVSNIIAELQAEGLLVEVGTRSVGRGLPAMQYGVNVQGGYAFGVEIRPDALFAALVDLGGTEIISRRYALQNHAPQDVLTLVQNLKNDMQAKAKIPSDKVLGAGIVIPGPFGKTGISGLGSDLTGWETLDARAMFERELGIPVELSNDANAAAMSERIAHGLSNFAYLYFGAGLGLGVVNHGQLLGGAFGNAGEIGHVQIMTKSGRAPLESHLSRVSLQAFIGSDTPLDIAAIERLFERNDPKLITWLDQACHALAEAVSLIENLFDPQTVILGGAMPQVILDHLIQETRLSDQSVSNRLDNPIPRLQRGTSGRMTATLGAAALILNRVFTPQAASL